MRGSRNLYDMETRPQCYYDKEGEKEEIEAYRGVAVSPHLTKHGGRKAERKRKGITKGVYIYLGRFGDGCRLAEYRMPT